jgi:DNA-binding PadR family transcriptional regulator
MNDPQRFLPLSPHQFHILLALTDRDRHGYGLIQDIEHRTDGALRLGTGTLYTAIGRLVELGLIADAGRPALSDADRPAQKAGDERRRYYRLLPLGRAVLRAETARLEALVRHAHDMGVRPTVAPAGGRRS